MAATFHGQKSIRVSIVNVKIFLFVLTSSLKPIQKNERMHKQSHWSNKIIPNTDVKTLKSTEKPSLSSWICMKRLFSQDKTRKKKERDDVP